MLRILHKLHFKKWIFLNNHLLSCPSYWQKQSHEEPGLCIFLPCMKAKEKVTWLCSKFFVSTWVSECASNEITIWYTCIFSQLLKLCLWRPKMISGKHKLHWGIWIWRKVLPICSVSLFEKLQLFCRVKKYKIIDANSNSHVLLAAIPCQGAWGCSPLAPEALRHTLEQERSFPAQLLTSSWSTILAGKFLCGSCILQFSFVLKLPWTNCMVLSYLLPWLETLPQLETLCSCPTPLHFCSSLSFDFFQKIF